MLTSSIRVLRSLSPSEAHACRLSSHQPRSTGSTACTAENLGTVRHNNITSAAQICRADAANQTSMYWGDLTWASAGTQACVCVCVCRCFSVPLGSGQSDTSRIPRPATTPCLPLVLHCRRTQPGQLAKFLRHSQTPPLAWFGCSSCPTSHPRGLSPLMLQHCCLPHCWPQYWILPHGESKSTEAYIDFDYNHREGWVLGAFGHVCSGGPDPCNQVTMPCLSVEDYL